MAGLIACILPIYLIPCFIRGRPTTGAPHRHAQYPAPAAMSSAIPPSDANVILHVPILHTTIDITQFRPVVCPCSASFAILNSMHKLIIGTLNRHKSQELASMLAGLPLAVGSVADFPSVVPVDETAGTLEGNAALKALGFARQVGEWVVADDSGLEVDALGGAPGVHSARYAGPDATYADLIRKLLREMRDVPKDKRTARFRCCICMASPDKMLIEAEGRCEGHIIFAPRGSLGFGYDPVFVPRGFDKTFAELTAKEKNHLSHRGAAVLEFRHRLSVFLSTVS
jgi:XTP/dITP diphosphohydrolase